MSEMQNERVTTVSEHNFQTEVLEASGLALVDFWAPWCGPCRAIAPVLERIATDHGNLVKICKVNVEDSPNLSARFSIRSIPYLAFFKNGQKVGELIGAQSENVILDKIKTCASK